MTIPVWQVITWKPVRTTVDEWVDVLGRMRQLGASVSPQAGPTGPARGQVLWGTLDSEQPIGIAWDWAEMREEVLALSDPMGVLSNVMLVDEDGASIDDSLRTVYLNTAIHEFGWQQQVKARRPQRLSPLAA